MDLGAYLDRIGFDGELSADRDSLQALMRAHVCSVSFENLDVQLGKPLTTSVAAAYRKIVDRRRGGWCYEQNGLFGWALNELGFGVVRMAGAVRDDTSDDTRKNNHLVLAVTCPGDDTTWLVDVGFGGSHFGPLRLEPQTIVHEPYELRLEQLPGGRWRFTERHLDSRMHYDFAAVPADESALARKCNDLQTNPASNFVLNLVVQKRTPTTHIVLRGRVLSEVSRERVERRHVDSADELVRVLTEQFGIELPEAESLWPRILARHEELELG
jgi:N-hydroxyarylamine O-acetyltransferase